MKVRAALRRRQFSNREFDDIRLIYTGTHSFIEYTRRLVGNAEARRERTMAIRNSYLNGASDKGKNS